MPADCELSFRDTDVTGESAVAMPVNDWAIFDPVGVLEAPHPTVIRPTTIEAARYHFALVISLSWVGTELKKPHEPMSLVHGMERHLATGARYAIKHRCSRPY
jgi:hypothetical protein